MLSQLFWQAWSFMEHIPTWFISCWTFGTHILTLLCAVVTIAEVACLRKYGTLLQQASEYFPSHLGAVLWNLLLMRLLWYFLSLFEITIWCHLMLYCLITLISAILTLLFVYFVLLRLDLVSASSPQHQEQKSLLPLTGWYDLEMHAWHLMNLSSFHLTPLPKLFGSSRDRLAQAGRVFSTWWISGIMEMLSIVLWNLTFSMWLLYISYWQTQ